MKENLLEATASVIVSGMYEYTDGTFSESFIKTKQVRGIVGYADRTEILIWCLRQKKTIWSSEVWIAGVFENCNGWSATSEILMRAKEYGIIVPAAQYCADYTEDGVEKGSAFMPTFADCEKLQPFLRLVKKAYEKLGLADFDVPIWLASEDSLTPATTVWLMNMDYGNRFRDYKYLRGGVSGYYVRPLRRVLL